MIDSAILVTEVMWLSNQGSTISTQGDAHTDAATMVQELRALYANDIQYLSPQFFKWTEDASAVIDVAVKLQSHNRNAVSHPYFSRLVELLDNLPYPETRDRNSRNNGLAR